MIKAYIILVHKWPSQVNRLVQALNDGESVFFIHVDKAAPIDEFKKLSCWGDKVRFLAREKTEWGSFALVRAVLNGLRAIRDAKEPFNHVILLSGQDYPIKSNAYISDFVREHANEIFIEHHRLPNPVKWQPNGGMYRVNKYYMGLKGWQRLSSKSLNFLSSHLTFLQRRPYKTMDPYAGSMWWMMNMEAVDYIIRFLKLNPGYIAFHRYTFAPDEVFFHMILLNAKKQELNATIVNDDKRFIKWKDIKSSHPEILQKDHLPELMHSNALFARKFDGQYDPDILDLIDNYRRSNK